MQHSDAQSWPDISVILPLTSDRIPVVHVANLPAELLEQINEVYLLHTLATNASRILPPGKSLISLLSTRNRRTNEANSQQTKSLKDKVTDVVTRAFWDEVMESLSSPLAAVQLTRLQLLYKDLCTAVMPLIPPSHTIMHTLSNPLSPTPSPLRSASGHLRTLLSVLRERCAPMRDANVDALMDRLHDVHLSDLPQAIVDTVKGIFDLADNMKEDLADYVVGTWTEQEARRWMKREALDRERRTVMEVFSAETLHKSYREWLGANLESSTSGTNRLINRLLEAFSLQDPVSPFPPSGNVLPPQLLFVAFDLVRIQNTLQALVIVASLRSLVRPGNSTTGDWVPRVWALLKTEVERSGKEPAETKLLNLEDEVVRAAGTLGDADTEKTLREAVRRTLTPEDPVFMLLQRRLTDAIRDRLTEQHEPRQMPAQMRTGRGILADAGMEEQEQESNLLVKGFEEAVLQENVKRVVVSLRECLIWMEHSWGDFLNNATV